MRDELEAIRSAAARAAGNPVLWPELLVRVGRLVGSDMTVLETLRKKTGDIEIGFTDRPDLMMDSRDAYERYYHRISPRWRVGSRLAYGEINHDDLIGDEAALDRCEYHMDFLRPSGLRYFAGASVYDDAERRVVLSFQRGPQRGRVNAEERRALGAALPDLGNAIAISLRLTEGVGGAPLAAVFERLRDPAAIVGSDGGLIVANAAMRRLIASGDIVSLDGPRLHAPGSIGAALARSLRIASAGSSAAVPGFARGAGRLIVRTVRIAPDAHAEFGAQRGMRFCLIIDDPRRHDWTQAHEAMDIFELTRREAQVGLLLAQGCSVDEAARRLGVARNTVRTHLAALREKLGRRSALGVAAEMRRALGPLA